MLVIHIRTFGLYKTLWHLDKLNHNVKTPLHLTYSSVEATNCFGNRLCWNAISVNRKLLTLHRPVISALFCVIVFPHTNYFCKKILYFHYVKGNISNCSIGEICCLNVMSAFYMYIKMFLILFYCRCISIVCVH